MLCNRFELRAYPSVDKRAVACAGAVAIWAIVKLEALALIALRIIAYRSCLREQACRHASAG
jgi:hypothetical protein